ncbi:MAG: TolC family protein, partial [Phycisphaerales bacterium]
FDALFVSNVDLTRTDEPTTVPILRGIRLGTPFSASERFRFETGVRKRFTSGAEASISTDLTRFRNLSPGIALSPDPAYTGAIRLGLTQPLLRGFGSKVNTSTIRLAQNAEQRAIHELRTDLLQLVVDVESAYWNLVLAWQDLAIQQWLLEVGVEVRDVLARRRNFDVTPAEESDAVARVEQRKANVIKARRAIRGASDALKVLVNDAQLTVGSEALLLPVDQMVQTPIRYNLRETIITAVGNRPEIPLAALGINDAEIRQHLADNARLPLLNLSAQLAYFGLDREPGDAYDNLFEGNFIDYILGFAFEWPLGNRAAEAEYRKARLQRSAAMISYRRAVQDVVVQVKSSLRDMITNYELIQATRSFRVAQAENLRTFLVQEDLRGLTPERLNLKFQRQETLAVAQQEEVRSLVQYSKSVARLYRAMGVSLAMNHIELEIADDGSSGGFDYAPPG